MDNTTELLWVMLCLDNDDEVITDQNSCLLEILKTSYNFLQNHSIDFDKTFYAPRPERSAWGM